MALHVYSPHKELIHYQFVQNGESHVLPASSDYTHFPFSACLHNLVNMASNALPPISHVLETCLYVRDVSASVKFYKETFQIQPFLETVRMPPRVPRSALSAFSYYDSPRALCRLIDDSRLS